MEAFKRGILPKFHPFSVLLTNYTMLKVCLKFRHCDLNLSYKSWFMGLKFKVWHLHLLYLTFSLQCHFFKNLWLSLQLLTKSIKMVITWCSPFFSMDSKYNMHWNFQSFFTIFMCILVVIYPSFSLSSSMGTTWSLNKVWQDPNLRIDILNARSLTKGETRVPLLLLEPCWDWSIALLRQAVPMATQKLMGQKA